MITKPAHIFKHYSFTGLNTAMKCVFRMQSICKPNWRILSYTVFLPWVHIMLQMYFPVIFSSCQNLCKTHLVIHVLFYKQNLREVIFFLLSKKCIPIVINDLQRQDQEIKFCILTNIFLRKSLRVFVCHLFFEGRCVCFLRVDMPVCFLRVDDCH